MKNNLRNKKKKGFTLIELIIVIAIIAIIAAIAIPKFGEVRKNANKNADIANAKQIQGAVSMVIAEGTVSLPSAKTTSFTFDGTAESNTDPNGIETAIKNQLQGAIPKIKVKNGSNTHFDVKVTDKGVTTIYSGSDIVYPQPATGTYAE